MDRLLAATLRNVCSVAFFSSGGLIYHLIRSRHQDGAGRRALADGQARPMQCGPLLLHVPAPIRPKVSHLRICLSLCRWEATRQNDLFISEGFCGFACLLFALQGAAQTTPAEDPGLDKNARWLAGETHHTLTRTHTTKKREGAFSARCGPFRGVAFFSRGLQLVGAGCAQARRAAGTSDQTSDDEEVVVCFFPRGCMMHRIEPCAAAQRSALHDAGAVRLHEATYLTLPK